MAALAVIVTQQRYLHRWAQQHAHRAVCLAASYEHTHLCSGHIGPQVTSSAGTGTRLVTVMIAAAAEAATEAGGPLPADRRSSAWQ